MWLYRTQAWKDIYGSRKENAPAPYKPAIFYQPPHNKVDSILTVADDADHKYQRKTMSSGFSERALRFESLARLPYLQAVLQESLRMYPPIPSILPRVVPSGGLAICGEWVPAGTVLGVHKLATYRREDSFMKPYEFHPQRWLHDT